MKAPKCRLCGERHYGQCGAGDVDATLNAMLAEAKTPRKPWHEERDSADEPQEIADRRTRPARFYAPPGTCVYCDRRREAAAAGMRAVRERGEA